MIKLQSISSYATKPTETRPLDALSQKAVHVAHHSWLRRAFAAPALKREFTAITPERLRVVLEQIALEPDGKEILERLAHIVPLDKVEQAFHANALDDAKDMTKEAIDYLKKIQKGHSIPLSTRLSLLLDSLQHILESFLNAFGIAEFFAPLETKAEGRVKAQTVMMLLQFSLLLTSLALPVFGPGLGGMIIGSALLSIWALSLIYPYIKRIPLTLPAAENWTRQYQRGQLPAGIGRQGTVDEVARILSAKTIEKTYPMLIGKQGVGKTELIKSLVEAIESGRYPDLKGKKVFYINTVTLLNKKEGAKFAARINEIAGCHREDVILVFDDIHIAFSKEKNLILGNQLKALFDEKVKGFPYAIGITTEERFYEDIYANNPTFARSFKQVPVVDTTPAETARILHHAVLKRAPKTLVAPHAFETLIQKTEAMFGKQTAHPACPMKIVSLCIKKIAETERSPLEQRIDSLTNQINDLYVHRGRHRDELVQLERQLNELYLVLAQERAAITRLYQDRDRLFEARKAMYQAALAAVREETAVDRNRFILLNQALLPTLEAAICREAKRLGVKVIIDTDLIDEVIREEQGHMEKARQAVSK